MMSTEAGRHNTLMLFSSPASQQETEKQALSLDEWVHFRDQIQMKLPLLNSSVNRKQKEGGRGVNSENKLCLFHEMKVQTMNIQKCTI